MQLRGIGQAELIVTEILRPPSKFLHGRKVVKRHDFSGVSAFEPLRSEEHTSELQSLMRISYAVFCLKIIHLVCFEFYKYQLQRHISGPHLIPSVLPPNNTTHINT